MRFQIHSRLKNIHSGERIRKVPDLPANSTDTCGQKASGKKKLQIQSRTGGSVG